MKNKIIIIIAITFLFVTCTKDKSIDSDDSGLKSSFVEAIVLTDFLTFYEQARTAENSYYIESFSGIYNEPSEDLSSISATISGNNTPLSLLIDLKSLSFSNYEYYPGDSVSVSYLSENMSSFYGKSFDLKLNQNNIEAKSDGSINNPIDQVYIPKLFYPVSFEGLTQEDRLTAGSKIKWDSDALNQNGVVIGIEYYPSTQKDSLNRINYPNYLLKGQLTDDDGEFTFVAADFADIPSNADLTFYILRGGYTSFDDVNGDKYCFIGIVITGTGLTISIP